MQVPIKADAFVNAEASAKCQSNELSGSAPGDPPGLTVEQLEEALEERARADRRVELKPLPNGFTDRRKTQRRQSD